MVLLAKKYDCHTVLVCFSLHPFVHVYYTINVYVCVCYS